MSGRNRQIAVLIFALVFPTALTWCYFVVLSGTPAMGVTYAVGKVIQFGLPLVWVLGIERRRISLRWPGRAGIVPGMVFGLAVAAIILGVYHTMVRGSSLLSAAPAELGTKLEPLGLASPAGFLMVAVFYSLVHSFLEEYYWRWFVFGRFREVVPVGAAMVISALGFMSHHVILLGRFLDNPLAVALFSAAIAVGGCVWAWIYQRSGSLLGPWWSHLLVDAAIMSVGFHLLAG